MWIERQADTETDLNGKFCLEIEMFFLVVATTRQMPAAELLNIKATTLY